MDEVSTAARWWHAILDPAQLRVACVDATAATWVPARDALLAAHEIEPGLITLTAPEVGHRLRAMILFRKSPVAIINPILRDAWGEVERRLAQALYTRGKEYWLRTYAGLELEHGFEGAREKHRFSGAESVALQHDLFLLNGFTLLDIGEPFSSTPERVTSRRKVGRNDDCPCGSRRKYKKCHGG